MNDLPGLGGQVHHDRVPGLGQRGGHASGSASVQGRNGGPRGGNIALSPVPCVISVLYSHIEVEIAAFISGSSCANATEVMLFDHSDRWDELPNVVKIAAALNARTKLS